jgi:hypothetical protein
MAAAHNRDVRRRVGIDAAFIELMNAGFKRRLFTDYVGDAQALVGGTSSAVSPTAVLKECARITSDHLELSVTKDEQLRELKRRQLASRSGLMRLIPQGLHKYVDYLSSLRRDPKPSELIRNLAVSGVFATVAALNARARMAALYAGIGHLAIMSILLMRNTPKMNTPMGMESKSVSWSAAAVRSAIGVSMLFAAAGGMATAAALYFLRFLPALEPSLRARIALAVSVLCSGLATSYYEVFEEKEKDGWRWKRALEGFLPEDVQARLKEQVFGVADDPMMELYSFAYDPEVDDYPPRPKYVDELPPGEVSVGGSGELDEEVAQEHFTRWMADRRDARKAPVLDARPEDEWVGAKEGMFVEADTVPKWLTSAYNKNVLQANKWRGRPARYEKDTAEFEPVEGPVGFRDKRPEWMDMFGTGIWEEKLLASRAAAREFGTYRKTMYKIDKKVVLKPCDGADKDT